MVLLPQLEAIFWSTSCRLELNEADNPQVERSGRSCPHSGGLLKAKCVHRERQQVTTCTCRLSATEGTAALPIHRCSHC